MSGIIHRRELMKMLNIILIIILFIIAYCLNREIRRLEKTIEKLRGVLKRKKRLKK